MPIPTHLLTQTVRVQRPIDVGEAGGIGIKWVSHIEGVPMRLRQLSGTEALRGGRENVRRQWIAYCERGHDITEDDRLEFTDESGPTPTTRALDITEVRSPHLMGHHLHLECEETEP